jgi:AcrR family transcriptional regulator
MPAPPIGDRVEDPAVVAAEAGDATRVRATPLPPGERRAEIVAAALPLVLAHGSAVTTKQIAEAAGVAEGTIFRVFPDKVSLIEAVVEAAFDTASTDAALAAIDAALPLEGRLVAAVEILRRRFADLLQLRTAVGMMQFSAGASTNERDHSRDLSALAALFEPDRDQLRRDPIDAAHLLRGLTIAGTHPALILEDPLPPSEIVSLLLDGIRRVDARPPNPNDPPC